MSAPVPASVPPPVTIGTVIDKYRLLEVLGKGGAGTAYLAEHLFLKRRVTVKVLSCDLSRWPEREILAFERGAAVAASLNHPNIVAVHDIDEHRGRPYIVMEYVDGEDLARRICRAGPLPIGEAVAVAQEVAKALEHAHEAGVVHRDVKPENILLAKDGRVKLTDFGLADRLLRSRITLNERTAYVVGTPHYVSPEQIRGKPADTRSDVYSLGVTLYEMVTARHPFPGRTATSVIRKHLREDRPALAACRVGIPAELTAAVQKMIALDPAQRYPNAAWVVPALKRLARA